MRLRSLIPVLCVSLASIALAQDPPTAGPPSDQPVASDQAAAGGKDVPKNDGQAMVMQWLRQMDQDKDQRIALQESRSLMKANFSRIDGNSDGFLERSELNALSQRLIRNRGRQQGRQVGGGSGGMSDDQVKKLAGDALVCELNVPYREGNQRWKLDLVRSAGAVDGLRPALVFVHGGGWVRGDKRTPLFLGQAIDFARKGYVCVTVNYRLDAAKLPCVQDVKCAVRWLRAHAKDYQIDPQRIGAYGNSAGAHLVSMLGVSATNRELEGDGPWQDYSSQVQAVAASATPTRPMSRGRPDAQLASIAPMTYVSADAPPFLLFHEASDRTVDVSHSDDFVKALKLAGAKDVTYRRLTDGSGHGAFNKNLKESSADMAEFFARTLKWQGDSKKSK